MLINRAILPNPLRWNKIPKAVGYKSIPLRRGMLRICTDRGAARTRRTRFAFGGYVNFVSFFIVILQKFTNILRFALDNIICVVV